jgi:hypothetical protein
MGIRDVIVSKLPFKQKVAKRVLRIGFLLVDVVCDFQVESIIGLWLVGIASSGDEHVERGSINPARRAAQHFKKGSCPDE